MYIVGGQGINLHNCRHHVLLATLKVDLVRRLHAIGRVSGVNVRTVLLGWYLEIILEEYLMRLIGMTFHQTSRVQPGKKVIKMG